MYYGEVAKKKNCLLKLRLSGSLLLTAMLIIATLNLSSISGATDPDYPLIVNKTISNGESWVDEITANVGDIVRFNISITYNKIVSHGIKLKWITVIDTLPLYLEYAYNATFTETDISSDGKTITWDLEGVEIFDGESFYLEFDVNVTGIGTHINNVYVKALETCPNIWRYAEANATVNVGQQYPMICISKEADVSTANAGDTVTYTYTVTNIGNCNLTNVSVTDDQGLVPICRSSDNGNNILELDETWIYNATAVLFGDVTNIGNVTAEDEFGNIVYDEDNATVDVIISEIHIEKDVNKSTIYPGESITYTYYVDNTGNFNLTNVSVVDDVLGPITNLLDNGNGNDILEPSETWIYTADANPINDVTNIGNVTAENGFGNMVYDEDTATVTLYLPKSLDVDNDGVNETATDADNDPSNGYETYADPNGNSDAVVSTDGDNDSKIDHFIDTTGDEIPEKYWDPDDGVLSDITLNDVDDDGTDEWLYDSDGNGTPDMYYDPDDGTVNDMEPPSKVTGLTVNDAKDGKLSLSWTAVYDNIDVDHYSIYRDGLLLTNVSGTTYLDTGLTNGQNYSYRVSAVDTSNNEGEQSDPVEGIPTAGSAPSEDGSQGGDTDENQPPNANANGPYYGSLNVPTLFNGSKSTDDGTIVSYDWDFGDNHTGTGVTTTHTYTEAENYTVTLTVTDDDGETATDVTYAIITEAILNLPPNKPIVNGTTKGTKNTSYTYTAMSTDPDNDTIKYIFDWGDGTNHTTSDFLLSGTIYNATHKWTNAGVYTLKVRVLDKNNATSENTIVTVLIDAHFVEPIGFLIDIDADGIYDVFQNLDGYETAVVLKEDGTYLIDSDGDGNGDYLYDSETDTLTELGEEQEEPQDEDNTVLLVTVFLALIILLLILVILTRKKEKQN